MFFRIIICILAGLGAGITTGFAGLSAAVFITPMLTVFLDVSFYDAVGIALASDVLASALSAFTYFRNGNVEWKKSAPLMGSVWLFAILGSILAFYISANAAGNTALGYWSIFGAILVGFNLFFRAGKTTSPAPMAFTKSKIALTIMIGAGIGFLCGFQGTGGGMMLLITLSGFMAFPYKTAVGTSVLTMALTALIGATSHFTMNGFPDLELLLITVFATTVFAAVGAYIANRIDTKKLKRATGLILLLSAAFMLTFKWIIR